MACSTLVLVLLVGLSNVSYEAGGCLNCFNECDENGECDDYGCLAEYHANNCSLQCPSNCRDGVHKKPVCDRRTAKCLSGCREGFFGDWCDQHCPSKCVDKTCVQMDGTCIGGCEAHWHGVNCSDKCNTTCYNSTCDRSGLCISCETGFWGFFCENTCDQHCLNNTCIASEDGSFVCSHGCQKGWKGSSCQEPILQDTRTRRGASDCRVEMVDGKCPCCKRNTGDMCDIDCPRCRTRYENSKCLRFCEEGYHNGTNGLCEEPCGKHCLLRMKDNKRSCNSDGSCHSCENGYHGSHCTYTCSPYCLNETCAIYSAYCLDCSNVTYGNHCEPCSQYCLGKYCHRWNGTCKTGCTRGRYGIMCSDECPTNCYKSNCSLSIYGSVKCTGCKDGFTGFSCEERCPIHCTVCRQLDGECLDRVLTVNTSRATTEQSPPTSPGNTQSDSKTDLRGGDIAGIVLGLLLLLLLLAAAVAVYVGYRKELLCFRRSPSSEPRVSKQYSPVTSTDTSGVEADPTSSAVYQPTDDDTAFSLNTKMTQKAE